MPKTYVVTGATGNTGRVAADILLDAGFAVRAVGRSAERLQPLVDKGAEPVVGELDDATMLARAYSGADAVYAMIPPNMQAEDYAAFAGAISRAHVTAIRSAGVENVVALSSIGAHRPDRNGIVKVLYNFEQDLGDLGGVNVLALRPSYFMDNLYPQIDIIKAMGFAGSPVLGDITMPVVHTRDIGRVVAARLMEPLARGFSVEYILGERDINYNDMVQVLGKAIGRTDLSYIAFPPEQALMGLKQFGFSDDAARLIVELSQGVNDGHVLEHFERTPANTTETSIEMFAEEFARVFKQ
jgi:uncharacterized protein YbjT (DUF2867 family)